MSRHIPQSLIVVTLFGGLIGALMLSCAIGQLLPWPPGPSFLLVLMPLPLVIVTWGYMYRKAQRMVFPVLNVCPHCGYDREGLPSNVCPECGRTPDDPPL